MATYTSFLNLEKPTTSERLDVLKINSNWDKIDEGVSSLNSNLTSKNINIGEFTSTVTNAWECTGLTIVVPSGHVFIGNLEQGYSNGRPLGIGVHDSNSLGLAGIPLKSAYDPNGLYTGFFLLTNGTWHVFTKRAGTGSNSYNFRYFDFNA